MDIVSLTTPGYVFIYLFVHWQVNISELGLVTQGGKVIWGELHLTLFTVGFGLNGTCHFLVPHRQVCTGDK